MEDILIAILQFLMETLLESLSIFPIGWSKSPQQLDSEERWGRGLLMFLIGAGIGWLSVLVFGHSLIRLSALRIANLVVAPIISALLAKGIANYRSQTNPEIIPRKRFWHAFWFTFGLVLVRFIHASHQ